MSCSLHGSPSAATALYCEKQNFASVLSVLFGEETWPLEDPGKEDRQFLQQSSQDHWEHQVAPSCFKWRAIYAQTLTCSLPPHSHPPHPLIWPHPQCATLTSNGGPILFRPKSGGLEEAARWVPNQMAGENQRSPEARCHFGGRRKAGTRSPVVELVNLIGSTHDDPKPIF